MKLSVVQWSQDERLLNKSPSKSNLMISNLFRSRLVDFPGGEQDKPGRGDGAHDLSLDKKSMMMALANHMWLTGGMIIFVNFPCHWIDDPHGESSIGTTNWRQLIGRWVAGTIRLPRYLCRDLYRHRGTGSGLPLHSSASEPAGPEVS